MFIAVTRETAGPLLGFLVVGTAFWPFVLAGTRGMVFGVLEDREQFQTVRAIYTAPIPWRAYVIGLALAQIAAFAVLSTVVTLLIGRFGLGISYTLGPPDLAYGAAALLVGVVAVISLGLISVSGVLLASSETWNLPEGIATGLYLLSGAIYPVSVLPEWLAAIAKGLPLTWWLESMRRALLPPGDGYSLIWASDARVLATAALLTAGFAALALALLSASERRARSLGLMDQRTTY